jgi:DNA-binding CsgD family transcriptional regulator
MHQPTLVGRDEERAALGDVVRRVRRGGRIAVVEGEAGIGKTRLVDSALEAARLAGATVLAAKAEELETHRPFGAIVDCVADGAWRARLDEHLRESDLRTDVVQERQFRVAETLLDMLDELCARAPVVLAVEDLHWADTGTIGVLARLARGIDRLPVALIVSARPQPRLPELDRLLGVLAERDAAAVTVGPLDDDACAELLAALVDARPGARLLAQAQRAGGNPLFVCELVAALTADGAIEHAGGAAEVRSDDVVPSLPLTILHRLSFLEPAVLELLSLAAVLGASFTADDLALLSGRPVSELVPALRAAQRAAVLAEQGDRLAFRHELIRDALYEDMPLSVRRGLHAQLAGVLADTGAPTERVAEHLLRGTAPGDEGAIAALVDAARDVAGRAPGVAVTLYRHAIALAREPDALRGRLLPELAVALVSAGLLGEGEETCREALSRPLDAEWAGRLRLQLVLLLTRRGRIRDAIAEGEQGLASGLLDARDRHELEAWVAMSRVFDGQIEVAVREAERIAAAGQDDAAVAIATNALAMAADTRGAFGEAADVIARNVRWVEAVDTRAAWDMRPHMIHGLLQVRLDRFDEGEATIRRGRAGSERLGLVEAVPVFHYQLALVDFLRGRLDDALAELAIRNELAELTDIGWHVPGLALAALIELQRDNLLAAERHVAAAEAEVAAGAPPYGIDMMVLARALLLEASGDLATAVQVIGGTFDAMATAGAATFLPLLGADFARLGAAAGVPERAAAAIPELERIAALNPGAPSLAAGALRARGLLERDAGALVEAAELLRASGRVLEAAAAAEDAAAAVGGDDALALLERARDAYAASGAVRGLARVEGALRGLGVRRGAAGRRGRPAKGWDALTDTELRVVRLVAERLTNPEIAERMFISRRTVQTHVSHALAKLDVSSRRELAAEAARRAGWHLRVDGVAEEPQQPEPSVEPALRPAVDGDDA